MLEENLDSQMFQSCFDFVLLQKLKSLFFLFIQKILTSKIREFFFFIELDYWQLDIHEC